MFAPVVDTSTGTGWPILDDHITDIGEEPSPSHLGRRRGVIMQSENKYYRPIIGEQISNILKIYVIYARI